jgi:hypothetical protein
MSSIQLAGFAHRVDLKSYEKGQIKKLVIETIKYATAHKVEVNRDF